MPTKLTDIDVDFISLVDRGANKRAIVWKNADRDVTDTLSLSTGRIIKADMDKRLVYGVVYAPDDVDTQGDFAEAAEIEKAAHRFMAKFAQFNVDRDHDFTPRDAYVAESFILRGDDSMFAEEKPGSWCVAIKVQDVDLWDLIKSGKIGGLSMAGIANRQEVEADEPSLEKALQKFFKPYLRLFGHKKQEDAGVDKEEIQKILQEAIQPLCSRLENLEKTAPHNDPQKQSLVKDVADSVMSAINDVFAPMLDRVEKLEKATPGSTQDNTDTKDTPDYNALGDLIAKSINR